MHDARFQFEALPARGIVGHFGGQDFERYLAAQARVAGAVDLAHATRAQRCADSYPLRRVPGCLTVSPA